MVLRLTAQPGGAIAQGARKSFDGRLGGSRELTLRVLRGEFGSLRVLAMLAVIWTVFQLANDRFLSAINLSNLMLQITAVGTISVGVTLVLLLGEIDLSVAAVSGLAGGVVAVLTVKHGWPQVSAVVVGLLAGAAIGAIDGAFVTRLRLPSFVVTPAGLIAWQGALLAVLGSTGTVNLPPGLITDLTGTFLAPWAGWAIAGIAVGGVVASSLYRRAHRAAQGLEQPPTAALLLRLVALAVAAAAALWVLNADRGVPVATVILLVVVACFAFLTSSTLFGRHVYAVGGNAWAARRAGIRVTRCASSPRCWRPRAGSSPRRDCSPSPVLGRRRSAPAGDRGPVIAGVSLFGGAARCGRRCSVRW